MSVLPKKKSAVFTALIIMIVGS